MAKSIFERLPKSIHIRDHRYKIRIVKKPRGESSTQKLDGIIWYDEVIEIKESLCPSQIEATILHEMLHGIGYHFGIRLTETMVRSLEKALYNVFKKNGWKIVVSGK